MTFHVRSHRHRGRTGRATVDQAMSDRRRTRAASSWACLTVVALLAAGCSDDPDGAVPKAADASTTTTAGADRAETGPGPGAGDWQRVQAPSSCRCSDGSPFHFWVRRGDPQKVLFFLAGGGACFSAETCASDTATYTTDLAGDRSGPDSGIFDTEEADNPLRTYSAVYVPYCTGDLHLGTATHDYGNGVVIDHNGSLNASTALAATAAVFPDAEEVVVAGSSAGSAGAPAFGGAAHDVFPDARISVIADSSAAYPGTRDITLAIGALWGVTGAIPPWPETADLPAEAWSLPGLFVNSAKHDPSIRFATYNAAYDSVQAAFSAMIGVSPEHLVDLIDENNRFISDAGVDVHHWVAPGTEHTILMSDEVFTQEVEGASLIEWLTGFLEGDDVPDVHCEDCDEPAAAAN